MKPRVIRKPTVLEIAQAADEERGAAGKTQVSARVKAWQERTILSCSNASRYTGSLKPRCNAGRPCLACKEKYACGPLRVGQTVRDTWYPSWGQGKVVRINSTKVLIDWPHGGYMRMDHAHVRAFIRKVI